MVVVARLRLRLGSGSGSSTSFSTSGSGSSSYDLDVGYSGFTKARGLTSASAPATTPAGLGRRLAWRRRNGPLGPSAFSSVGFAFSPGDPVSVAPISDQTNTEGDSVSLQVQATDWSAGSGASSGSGSGATAPRGCLTASTSTTSTGLITGAIDAGDAATVHLRYGELHR